MNATILKEFAFDYIAEQDNLSKNEKLILGTYVHESDKYQVMHLLSFGSMVPPMTEEMNGYMEDFFTFLSEIDWRKAGVKASVKAGEYIEKGAQKGVEIAAKRAFDPRKGFSALKNLARSWASYRVPDSGLTVGGFKIPGSSLLNKDWRVQYVAANSALEAGAAIAAIAAATMIFMLGKKAYKATLSKAARDCRKYKGRDKAECIRRFHVNGIKHDISVMEKNKSACDATKKPDKCKSKVDKRIDKQRKKLKKALETKKPKKL